MLVNAIDRFARRTAEACVFLWDRGRIIDTMKRMGESHEKEVVKQIEKIQEELVNS